MMSLTLQRTILGAAWLWGSIAGPAGAAGRILTAATDPASGVRIEIESWLDACPPSGMAPVTIKITNRGDAAHEWTITAQDGYGRGVVSSINVRVDAGRSAEVPFYAQTALRDPGVGGFYRTLNFQVQGPGARGFAGQIQQPDSMSRGPRSSATPFLGMSAQLSAKGWSALSDKFDKAAGGGTGSGAAARRSSSGGVGFDATQVDITKAPEDWRGYSGLAQLWMTDGEWGGMGSAAKAALLEWVALGGRVTVFTSDASESRLGALKLPPAAADGVRRIGAGRIGAQMWDGNGLPLDEAFNLATNRPADPVSKQLANYGTGTWKLRDAIGAPALPAGLIFGFIVIFGVLVGPVNLYFLAGPGRRQRLFWTTPLISLAGSALLLILMILQDGLGGSGARRVLALMLPEQNKLALMQEQISRTGVLLGRSFLIEEPSWMQQVAPNPAPGAHYGGRLNGLELRETDLRVRGGDWFLSRATQAQVIQAVRPSRGRVEVFPGAGGSGPPSVLSSLGAPLSLVFVVDDQRRCWRVRDLGTGEKKPMEPCSESDLQAWLSGSAVKTMGPMLTAALEAVRRSPGQAFAESAAASRFAVKTLSAIRWNDDRVIFAGPYVRH